MKDASIEEYLDIDSLTKKFPQFTKNQLRWIVANKERYGISQAIKRVGRKLYFHIPAFAKWLEGQSA